MKHRRGVGIDVAVEDDGCRLGGLEECRRLRDAGAWIQRVGGRKNADENEHDETHAFLSVVGTVEEADAGARQNEEPANPRGRRLVLFGGGIELRAPDELLGEEQEEGRADKADDGRDEKRGAHLLRLGPIHTLSEFVAPVHPTVGEAHAHDGADEGVRARSREPQVPGPEVPDDGRDEEREDHRETSAGPDIHHQLDGQQRQHGESHRPGGGEDAEEIPNARPHHGDGWLQCVRVADGGHGVGRVVKAVDEFEAQREAQRQQEEDGGSKRQRVAEEVHGAPVLELEKKSATGLS